jgi:hypothetical protein
LEPLTDELLAVTVEAIHVNRELAV